MRLSPDPSSPCEGAGHVRLLDECTDKKRPLWKAAIKAKSVTKRLTRMLNNIILTCR